MVTDCNWSYCGDHLDRYRNIKSLCCVTGTDIVLTVDKLHFKSKQLIEKESRFVVLTGSEWRGNWMKVVEMYNLPLTRWIGM